ncbi:MAG: hypothetical protein NVS1B10_02890 [Candidatus Saccharimonadales bacterium]
MDILFIQNTCTPLLKSRYYVHRIGVGTDTYPNQQKLVKSNKKPNGSYSLKKLSKTHKIFDNRKDKNSQTKNITTKYAFNAISKTSEFQHSRFLNDECFLKSEKN